MKDMVSKAGVKVPKHLRVDKNRIRENREDY